MPKKTTKGRQQARGKKAATETSSRAGADTAPQSTHAAAADGAQGTAGEPTVRPIDGVDVNVTSAGVALARRRAERSVLDERVQVWGVFGGLHEENLHNASAEGVFVETARVLDVGDPVGLTFTLVGGRRLQVSGRVRWVTPFGTLKDARPGMGIELVGMRPEARKLLAQHIASRGQSTR